MVDMLGGRCFQEDVKLAPTWSTHFSKDKGTEARQARAGVAQVLFFMHARCALT